MKSLLMVCCLSVILTNSAAAQEIQDRASIDQNIATPKMSEKTMKGVATIQKLFGQVPQGSEYPAEFTRMTIENIFGDLWQGKDLAIEERSLITCSILVALNRESEQKLHFSAARNLGIERKKLEAVITHAAHYAGWPVAVSAFNVLNEVWPKE